MLCFRESPFHLLASTASLFVEDVMLVLSGPQALSPFRLARLLVRLQAVAPVSGVSAVFAHLVDADREISVEDQQKPRRPAPRPEVARAIWPT